MEKKPNKQTNKVFENLIIGENRTCGFLGYGKFLVKEVKERLHWTFKDKNL